tara:strand:- start:258 stop:1232 length:975 start_codon:yes stop_codon:yes gene_type:complete
MKILYLSPRLDCSFKKGDVPPVEGPPNHPVRLYWVEFEKRLLEFSYKHGHSFEVLKKALWEFTPEDVKGSDCDIALVPHHDYKTFDAGPRVRYYMQMGFPWLFSIDTKGWCGDAADWPIPWNGGPFDPNLFTALQKELIEKNISKFHQPDVKVDLPDKFILFCCQLPHDMTILRHSNTTVDKALLQTMEFAHSINMPVVAKGHPINPGSMIEIKNIFDHHKQPGDMWVDNASIHQCLSECEAMFSVNSGGTGLDAILHKKPLFVFGRVDFQSIAHTVDTYIEDTWENKDFYLDKYASFIYNYSKVRFNVNDLGSFDKLHRMILE